MIYDDVFNIADESIPRSWVLTVRKCSCGQTLFWDKKGQEWHCMKESCPNYKSHLTDFGVTEKTINFIRKHMKTLTAFQIASKLGISVVTVTKVIKYYKDIEG